MKACPGTWDLFGRWCCECGADDPNSCQISECDEERAAARDERLPTYTERQSALDLD